ncbi:MAG TPA: FAD-dependent oxidoreductase [Candidatus Brocadiia bacterium]|nr:NAD(P)/FAD-dependent oxidoreductase [Candidatus Brocadiales bacterium]
MTQFQKLFSPFKIGSMELKNRIVMPAMETHLCDKEGFVTDELISYYRARAKGGVGYITIENTAVDLAGKINDGMLCIFDDKYIPGLKRLVDAIHDCGGKFATANLPKARVVIQLSHAGKEALSRFTGQQAVAPSAIPSPITRQMPRELRVEEIPEIVKKFADGAKRVLTAGADGVEIHMAHGYLVNQFLSPETNLRNDAYGGDTQRRTRFAREIVECIRERVPQDYPVICRISVDEYTETGLRLEESKEIAKILEKAGASAIHASACNSTSAFYNIPCYYLEEGCFVSLAEGIKSAVNVPVIAVGRIMSPELAEDILQENKADLVTMGRALIADSELPNKVKENRLDDIKPCGSCNRCIESIIQDRLICTINPDIGRESELEALDSQLSTLNSKKVLVIGGGPAGLSAAAKAAQRGHEVTLWERESELGGTYRYAAMAPKKEPMRKQLDYLISQVEKSGVSIECGKEATLESVKGLVPDAVIVATGSKETFLNIPGVENNSLLGVRQAFLRSDEMGQNVAIIGGGPEGCELADFLASIGKNVTIIEMKRMLGMGLVGHPRYHVGERLKKAGVKIHLSAKVVEVGKDSVVVSRRQQDNETLNGFDSIVMASEHKSDNALVEPLKEIVKDVYVVGDALEPRTALEAIAEGTKAGLEL